LIPDFTCQLLIPETSRALQLASDAPSALQTLLRFARRGEAFEGDGHAWRCHFFGAAQQQDWPVAPFSCFADGLDPGSCYWLCADPVHLLLQRDTFAVAEGVRFDLTAGQVSEIVESLNSHFAADGMRFFAPHPSRWYLRLEHAPRLQTIPLAEAAGHDMQPLMPGGPDALQWHRCLNEIQMLLHAHPVNQALEQQGRLPVNSLWLWGGGELSQSTANPGTTVWANDPLTVGLVKSQGVEPNPLPPTATDWLEQHQLYENHLIVLDSLDISDMQHRLSMLEKDWFAPMLAALRAGRLARLDLHLAGTQAVRTFSVTRNDLYKFWRRPKKLEEYLG
jgi:hypothetical protein